jgi:hypothetical protein
MTAADKRVEELLDRWMASLELHARYLKLDDAAYARAEAWPKHQRPSKWVVELARQRLLELRAHLTQRQQAGDGTFAESLELMAFLTGLLGSEHLERFIPLATGKGGADAGASGTVEQPRARPGRAKASPTTSAARTSETKPAAAPPKPAGAAATRDSASKSANTGPHATTRSAGRSSSREAAASAPAPAAQAAAPQTDARSRQVIADAVRMLGWGREWPALAGLIARMADRPSEQDVWKILRAHRAEILTKARRPAD